MMLLAVVTAAAAAATAAAPPADTARPSDAARPMEVVSRWSFEKEAPGANGIASGPALKIEKAVIAEGHAGTALAFEDWSVKDYLHPDPGVATRVVVPREAAGDLGSSYPVRISAWIYPTADPVYYGGVVERGNGYGASFRLILLRGLRVGGSVGRTSLRSSAPVTLNNWHEVVLTVDGKTATLTVDGAQAASAELSSSERTAAAGRAASEGRAASSDPLVIGERFSGRIDEVSIAR